MSQESSSLGFAQSKMASEEGESAHSSADVDSADAEAYVEAMGIFGDPRSCTYEDGPSDQFVMVCEDCTAKNGDGRPVAVCVACAFRCHANHSQIEVGAKKALRCDCAGTTCAYNASGADRPPNETNRYDPRHNFEGRFCWCDRPFEAGGPGLSQCLICSDWYHLGCVELAEDAEDGCLICRDCVHHVQRYVATLEIGAVADASALQPPPSCPELLPCNVDPRAACSVLLISQFRNFLCQCATCEPRFASLFLKDEETAEISAQEIFQAAMEGLPHDQQIELAHMGAQIHSAIEEAKANVTARKRGPLDQSDLEEIYRRVSGRIETWHQKRQKGSDD